MRSGVENPPAETHDAFDRYRHVIFRGVRRGSAALRAPSQGGAPNYPPLPDTETLSGSTSLHDASFIRHILTLAGLDTSHYRLGPLARRIPACLRLLRAGSTEAARQVLAKHPAKLTQAVNTLLIGTTGFFRDTQVFDHLRDEIVPDLLRSRPFPKVWSAACSDGAELYSVAMLFAGQSAVTRGQFYGTDCRASAIETARRGSYSTDFPGVLSRHHSRGHLIYRNGNYQVSPGLREAMRWEINDIFETRDPGTWDLILCRNLAIYLDPKSVRKLWERLDLALAPGGTLVVGKAEKVNLPSLRRVAPCIYRKVPIH